MTERLKVTRLGVREREVQVVEGEVVGVRLGVGEAEGLAEVPEGLAVGLSDGVNLAVGRRERLRLVKGVRVEGVTVADGVEEGADWLSVSVQLKVAVARAEGKVPDGLQVGERVVRVAVAVAVGADAVREAGRDAVGDRLSVGELAVVDSEKLAVRDQLSVGARGVLVVRERVAVSVAVTVSL